jgi:hypothetical protein
MNRASEPLATGATTMVVARETRWLRATMVLVVALVAIAALKPWGSGSEPIRAGAVLPAIPLGEHAAVSSGETPAASPTRPPDLAEMICGQPLGWRVVASGLWQGHPSRASIALTPVAADRPIDAGIPFVVADGDRVDDLGWCSPAMGRPNDGTATVIAWRIDNGVARVLGLRRVPSSAPSRVTGLYEPDAPSAGSPWLAGRYVFRVDRTGEARASWFGVEVRIQPLR